MTVQTSKSYTNLTVKPRAKIGADGELGYTNVRYFVVKNSLGKTVKTTR